MNFRRSLASGPEDGEVMSTMPVDHFAPFNKRSRCRGRSVPGRWSRIRSLVIAATLAGAVSIVPVATAGPAAAYSGPANLWACRPNPVPAYYQGEISNLINATYGICAAIPYGTYGQTSGWTTVGGGRAWFYVQQNPNGYTQLQLSGPGYWWAYWQQNPRDWSHGGCSWYQEQVNTWSGGPYFHTTGWYCG
jgi:hypothetical protein